MRFKENEKCPVCDKLFSEDDDIVVCPKCGAPHHRECYSSLGHCSYRDKHSDDFTYTPVISSESSAPVVNEPSAQESSSAGYIPFTDGTNNGQPDGYAQNVEQIEGRSAVDIAATVKSNSQKFIAKFRKNGKLSWNWSALVFGPYYFFFRKMYREGAVIMAIRMIIAYVIDGIFINEMNAFASEYMKLGTIIADKSNTTEAIMAQYDAAMKAMEPVLPAFIILLASVFVIHIICALIADGLYKKRVFAIIDNMDKNIDKFGGMNFEAAQLGISNMNEEQKRLMFLGHIGGTNIFSPIVAYCIVSLITNLISKFVL